MTSPTKYAVNGRQKHSRVLISLAIVAVFFCLSSCFRTNTANDIAAIKSTNQTFNLNTVEDLYRFLTYSENRVPLISAHRGGPYLDYPENAIETFAHIAGKRPSIIECDIRMTKDSVLILMHDETLDRTTTGKGRVSQYSIQQIKELKLRDNEGKITDYPIPTLQEALKWGAGRVIFTLDVKRNVPYDLVIDAIRREKAEPYSVIITYSANQAAKVHRLAPDLMISASIKTKDDLFRLNDRSIPDTRIVAFVGTSEPDFSLINTLHQHGIMCILGTIGNLDRQAKAQGDQVYADYIENGADILSTDRPIEAGKAVDYYIKKRGLSSTYIN